MDALTLALVVLLIGVGIILIVAEVLLPTAGVLAVAGGICVIAGVCLPFYYGDRTSGLVTLVVVLVLTPVVPWVLSAFDLWEHMLVKKLEPSGADEDATIASMPVIAELEQLRGRVGRAVSALRPCGVVEFDGKRIDVLTEGMMVEEGAWVRCIEVKAGKVVVRPAAQPQLSDLENMDLS